MLIREEDFYHDDDYDCGLCGPHLGVWQEMKFGMAPRYPRVRFQNDDDDDGVVENSVRAAHRARVGMRSSSRGPHIGEKLADGEFELGPREPRGSGSKNNLQGHLPGRAHPRHPRRQEGNLQVPRILGRPAKNYGEGPSDDGSLEGRGVSAQQMAARNQADLDVARRPALDKSSKSNPGERHSSRCSQRQS